MAVSNGGAIEARKWRLRRDERNETCSRASAIKLSYAAGMSRK